MSKATEWRPVAEVTPVSPKVVGAPVGVEYRATANGYRVVAFTATGTYALTDNEWVPISEGSL